MSWKDTSLSDLPRVSSTLSDISGDSSRQFATFPKSMSGKTSLKSLRRASSSVIEKHIIVNVDQDETDEIKQLMKDEGLSRDEAVKQFFDDHDDKLFNPKAVYLFPGEVYTPKKHDDDDDEDEDGMFGHVKYHHRASLMSPPAAPVTPPPAAEPEPEPEPEPPQSEQRIIGLKKDPDQEALEHAMLLSQQEAEFGINMYDSLTDEDSGVLDGYISQGFTREEGALIIFEEKFGKLSTQKDSNVTPAMPTLHAVKGSHFQRCRSLSRDPSDAEGEVGLEDDPEVEKLISRGYTREQAVAQLKQQNGERPTMRRSTSGTDGLTTGEGSIGSALHRSRSTGNIDLDLAAARLTAVEQEELHGFMHRGGYSKEEALELVLEGRQRREERARQKRLDEEMLARLVLEEQQQSQSQEQRTPPSRDYGGPAGNNGNSSPHLTPRSTGVSGVGSVGGGSAWEQQVRNYMDRGYTREQAEQSLAARATHASRSMSRSGSGDGVYPSPGLSRSRSQEHYSPHRYAQQQPQSPSYATSSSSMGRYSYTPPNGAGTGDYPPEGYGEGYDRPHGYGGAGGYGRGYYGPHGPPGPPSPRDGYDPRLSPYAGGVRGGDRGGGGRGGGGMQRHPSQTSGMRGYYYGPEGTGGGSPHHTSPYGADYPTQYPPVPPAPLPVPAPFPQQGTIMRSRSREDDDHDMAVLLSQQESECGTNMMEALTPADEPEIARLMRQQGLARSDAMLAIFNYRHPPRNTSAAGGNGNGNGGGRGQAPYPLRRDASNVSYGSSFHSGSRAVSHDSQQSLDRLGSRQPSNSTVESSSSAAYSPFRASASGSAHGSETDSAHGSAKHKQHHDRNDPHHRHAKCDSEGGERDERAHAHVDTKKHSTLWKGSKSFLGLGRKTAHTESDVYARAAELSRLEASNSNPAEGIHTKTHNKKHVPKMKYKEKDVQHLVRMGFNEEQAVQALVENNNDVSRAADALLALVDSGDITLRHHRTNA